MTRNCVAEVYVCRMKLTGERIGRRGLGVAQNESNVWEISRHILQALNRFRNPIGFPSRPNAQQLLDPVIAAMEWRGSRRNSQCRHNSCPASSAEWQISVLTNVECLSIRLDRIKLHVPFLI